MSKRVTATYLRMQQRLKNQSNIFHFFEIDSISETNSDNALQWCEINTKGRWGVLSGMNTKVYTFYFEIKADAALFALFIK